MLAASQELPEAPQQSPSLEDCLKLLKGGRDEQRLAGLLLVTKFCKSDDYASIRRVYDAVGVHFLDRLLKTGMGLGGPDVSGTDNRDAYLQLALSVLAAFCRVPEIASSRDIISKIPLVLKVMVKESGSPVLEECYEYLLFVSAASEMGSTLLCESKVISVIASQISSFMDGSHLMELAIKLLHSLLRNLPLGNMKSNDLSILVHTIARQFAVLHTALKFEAFHLLCAMLSTEYMALLRDANSFQNDLWSTYIRVGIMAILQNRVAPAEKLQALVLSESLISVLGEEWLVGELTLPGVQECVLPDRFILLIFESARVEIAVLLNDLAYLKYEVSNQSSSITQTVILKQQNLAIAYTLTETIIKLISNNSGGNFDKRIHESTYIKVIDGLNETIGIVLNYLQDAKEHKQNKGDDLLASVRIVGSFLAETPIAFREEISKLLGYMLSVEGDVETSPYFAVRFLLPMLCQITMEAEGWEVLIFSGGYKLVVECLISFVGQKDDMIEDNCSLLLACDTIMNLLLKKKKMQRSWDETLFVNLLKSLVYWAEDTEDMFTVMMASSLCALILGYTSEEALLSCPNIDHCTLSNLSRLIVRSLAMCEKDMCNDGREMDLRELISREYCQWAHRFPQVKEAVGT